jgi:hypothetical protein
VQILSEPVFCVVAAEAAVVLEMILVTRIPCDLHKPSEGFEPFDHLGAGGVQSTDSAYIQFFETLDILLL